MVLTSFHVFASLYYLAERKAACHRISCSKASNSGVEKNSASVISSPSQIFLIVRIFGSVLLPYRMFLIEDGGNAEIVASLLMEISRSAQRQMIRSFITVIVSIAAHLLPSQAYRNPLAKVGYACYYLGYT